MHAILVFQDLEIHGGECQESREKGKTKVNKRRLHKTQEVCI